jgi:membrane-associated protease RseP (regulator of RpoE activity)
MWKTLLLVVAGLGAGFAIALWTQPGYPPPGADSLATVPDVAVGARTDAAMASRLEDLESALQAEIEQRASLEQRVIDLGAELDAFRAPRQARTQNGGAGGPPAFDPASGVPNLQTIRRARADGNTPERQVERLVAAGFTPDRAAWIQKRTEQLTLEQMQAQYTARREGKPVEMIDTDSTLRSELGEQDYERYLTATGRPTTVGVFNVIAGSPGERAGIKPGDQIVSYAGERIFDVRDLNDRTFKGTPGESVMVEVMRDGQKLQLVVPRGPIGISGGPGAFRRGP